MHIIIYAGQQACGSCIAEEEGLYWRITAICREMPAGLTRLWCEKMPLGVFKPDGTLFRRFSKRSCPSFPPRLGYLTLEPEAPVRPWSGSILGCPVPEGFLRRTEQGCQYLFPIQEDAPFPSMALFCFFRRENGCWSIALKPDGTL